MNTDQLSDKEYLEKARSMQFIGATEEHFEYLHPDGNRYKSKFEFYWNTTNGDIDVCHLGCNGAEFTGKVNEDGSVTFYSIPDGYPEEAVFEKAFKKLQEEFLTKQQR
ncbi:hypothetical protein MYX06_02350 [Patescibacteria group bacterium AH-259-L05]|nr:hypothetical protein [Patescibacteria group bacterium AH-259-L05]